MSKLREAAQRDSMGRPERRQGQGQAQTVGAGTRGGTLKSHVAFSFIT